MHKDYVLDYTSPLKNVLQETESGAAGLTYRYVYGIEKLNTVITGIPNGVGSVAHGMGHADNTVYDYTDESMALAPGSGLYMANNA